MTVQLAAKVGKILVALVELRRHRLKKSNISDMPDRLSVVVHRGNRHNDSPAHPGITAIGSEQRIPEQSPSLFVLFSAI